MIVSHHRQDGDRKPPIQNKEIQILRESKNYHFTDQKKTNKLKINENSNKK